MIEMCLRRPGDEFQRKVIKKVRVNLLFEIFENLGIMTQQIFLTNQKNGKALYCRRHD